MADDALHLDISGPLSERIKAAAEESGLSADAFVQQTLEAALDDIEEDVRRIAEPGEDIDAEIVFAELRENIEKARRAKS